ncbi:MAG: biotin--[acetyl-CoA-carboxylase] ligase, partial [Rhodobacteraceae bacterium]|nr:biotin--[acetyl-CoA-carboxylase] ligase [Paracoccaceae bacterium]
MSNNFPIGYDRRILASVDSTNAEAVRIAKTVSGPTWILGLRQTQGRGRRGRAWMDPEGNFAGTLLLFPDGDPHSFALRSFVMSLALADSFETLFPHQVTCQLKWPNDALLNGAKVAGILLETVALSAGQMALAIGVGVNLKNAPEASNLENRALPPASIYG